jgi:hypothetical protein
MPRKIRIVLPNDHQNITRAVKINHKPIIGLLLRNLQIIQNIQLYQLVRIMSSLGQNGQAREIDRLPFFFTIQITVNQIYKSLKFAYLSGSMLQFLESDFFVGISNQRPLCH